MFNTLLTFMKDANSEGRRIDKNIRSVKEKQYKHDSHLNQY